MQACKTSTFTNSLIDNELPSNFSLHSTILNDTSTQRPIPSIDGTASLESLSRRKPNTSDEADSQKKAEEVEALRPASHERFLPARFRNQCSSMSPFARSACEGPH